jgi:hypothetical protein
MIDSINEVFSTKAPSPTLAMKKVLQLIVYSLILFSSTRKAQGVSLPLRKAEELKPTSEASEQFSPVDVMSVEPGGSRAVMHVRIQKTISYPESAVKNKNAGTVYISFIIEASSEVSTLT